MTKSEYLQAKRNLEDPRYVRQLMRVLNGQLISLFAYNAFQHSEHAAVQTVAESKFILADLLKDFEEMDQYEAKQKEDIENG